MILWLVTLGALHPVLANKYDLPKGVFMFELELDEIPKNLLKAYKPFAKFPSIKRDLSLVVPRDVSYADLQLGIESLKIKQLRNIALFDSFQCDKLQKDQKLLAISFIFQHHSKTLLDQEVNGYMSRIMTYLNTKNIHVRAS